MCEYKIAFSTMQLDGKLVPGDSRWGAFNASFENIEAAPALISWLIDDGYAFTTWHKDNWRKSTNYLLGQHLGVDFDTQGVEQTLRDPFVQRYAAIVYATPSSTPDNPRCRALFLLDTPIMQAQNYSAAAMALIFMFGGVADRKCKDAARFFYGSEASTPTRLNNVLPLAIVKSMIARHNAAQAMIAPPRTRPATYRPTTTNEEDAVRLLDRLSPSRADDYEEWVNIGMILHSLGDAGLHMWDNWSRKSSKWTDGECAAKWRSFSSSGALTFATLAYYAQQDSPK